MQSSILYCKLSPLTHDVRVQKFRDTEKIGDKKFSVEHTLHVQPGLAHWWGFKLRTFKPYCGLLS